jgi:hypothetical protein
VVPPDCEDEEEQPQADSRQSDPADVDDLSSNDAGKFYSDEDTEDGDDGSVMV